MKTKLLKQVRKRFEIIHMPNGFIGWRGGHFDYNLFKLVDKKEWGWNDQFVQLGYKVNKIEGQYCSNVFYTEKECIEFLKAKIVKRLRSEGFRQRKDKTIVDTHKKVWHKI
jgi:hypothetical protein